MTNDFLKKSKIKGTHLAEVAEPSVDDATTEAVAIVPARTLGGLPVTRVP